MLSLSHIPISIAISMPIAHATGNLIPGPLIAVAIGAILPDIDEPNSIAGKKTKTFSNFLKANSGHRGITHSLLALAIVAALLYVAHRAVGVSFAWAAFLALGYFLHLLEDSFSKAGIAWLQPFSRHRFQSGFHLLSYKTGGKFEVILAFLATIAIIIQFLIYFNP